MDTYRNVFRRFLLSLFLALSSFFLFAVDTTTVYFGTLHIDVPNDLLPLINENKDNITKSLNENGVTQAQLDSVQSEIINSYNDFATSSKFSTGSPYTTSVNGLNGFCDSLSYTVPNTQLLQNVWALSCIGSSEPGFHFGAGFNTGVASLDISSLKRTAKALSLDMSGIGTKIVFPTITADMRVGIPKLPLDAGMTASFIDSSKIGALDNLISPVSFNYFSVGGDVRYCFFQLEEKLKISVSAGGYYTKGGFGASKNNSSLDLDFNSTTLFVGAQANTKVLCFIPFIGTKIGFSKSNVTWKAKADWEKVLDKSNSNISDAIKWGILPSKFEGKSDSKWEIHPQIYGGMGIDIFCIDLTTSASYDFAKNVLGGTFSIRFSK